MAGEKSLDSFADVFSARSRHVVLLMSAGQKSSRSPDQRPNSERVYPTKPPCCSMVLILKSWINRASQESNPDMTPPSESYEREEVVTLIGQSKDGNFTRMYPIVRQDNGTFWDLGDPIDLGADSFSGRFAGLLPAKEVDLTICANWAKNFCRLWGSTWSPCPGAESTQSSNHRFTASGLNRTR